MSAILLDGVQRAAEIRDDLRREMSRAPLAGAKVRLASLAVGANVAGAIYARHQAKACADLGIELIPHVLPEGVEEEEVVRCIQDLNVDPAVTGILLQRPFPPGINARRLQAKVHPDRDVEGMNPANLGLIVYGEPRLAPCTALAAIDLGRRAGVPYRGRDVVVVGSSEIVGKPIAFLLLNEFATVNVCHVETRDLASHTRDADFLFVAVGRPGLITGDMVKPGAVVIDIGVNRLTPAEGEPERTVGDVDAASVREVAGHLTPVPGGVGPVTVAMLLRNTLRIAKKGSGYFSERGSGTVSPERETEPDPEK